MIDMNKELIEYFKGDDLAADVWASKYQVKGNDGKPEETTPVDMHKRLAKEFARIEHNYSIGESINANRKALSEFGQQLLEARFNQSKDDIEAEVFNYFNRFKWIIPQGSIMSILGHPYKTGSLSNCFVVPSPYDSYGGILRTDEHLVQLMKRRGGVGMNLNTLRPAKTIVSNAAGTSTGAPSFMHRYSNSTREVAQDGRRGALMLLLHCLHPDIFDYVKMKKDRTKVTGANISVMLIDTFMKSARGDADFYCHFPIDEPIMIDNDSLESLQYNKLHEIKKGKWIMKIHAKELLDLIFEMAWENAEPGVAFMDRIINFSPDGCYAMFKAIASNPCGEQWLQAYDSCRLLALNLFSIVDNPFTKNAKINYNKLYEVSYMQQRLADDMVELEIEHVNKIIEKIKADPEPEEAKRTELELWENILKTAKAGRRTGCGFTALADMLAALNLKYDSEDGIDVITNVCKIKMKAELDCTIDMSILRGSFEGWDPNAEFIIAGDSMNGGVIVGGCNTFYDMLLEEFPEQAFRMCVHGRRNVSWSTVAPTGTVSIMTQTTSGLEPLFLAWYMRRKKINPNDKNSRVDFTDQNGDTWQEFAVLHPKFKEWLLTHMDQEGFEKLILNKEALQRWFEESPWYGSCANDISWKKRVEIQAVIQRYTTNAISSTINLPNSVTKEEVAEIYWRAWELGLKGVTVYRDGCRTGVLVSNSSTTKEVSFSQKDAIKRPKSLDCEVNAIKVKGVSYNVIVSVLEDHPYEVFVLPLSKVSNKEIGCEIGTVVKEKKGLYNLYDPTGDLCVSDIGSMVTEEEAAIARLISTALRHGTDVRHLVEQLNKTEGNMVGFSKAIARTLKKFIPEGTTTKEECPECHQAAMIYEEGCKKCKNCGYSKC